MRPSGLKRRMLVPGTYNLKVTKLAPEVCAWLSVSATPVVPVTIAPGASADITVTVNVPSSAKAGTYNAVAYVDTSSGDRLGMVPVTLTVE